MLTRSDLPSLIKGWNAIAEQKQKASDDSEGDQLKAYLTGQQKKADVTNELAKQKGMLGQNSEAAQALYDKNKADAGQSGITAEAGEKGATIKTNEQNLLAQTLKQQAMNQHQAKEFDSVASKEYKPLHDQLDSSKTTLNYLNQGNATADKLALINEARLSLAGSGGRGVGQMVSLLSGDPTMASDSQKAMNWLQNTPNLPALQPAQRDAIRESVLGRIPELSNTTKQLTDTLKKRGQILSPQDANNVLSAHSESVQSKLNDLSKMAEDYQTQKQKLGGPNVSNPAVANANPTTLGKLGSWLQGIGTVPTGGAPSLQAAPQAPSTPPLSFEEFKKRKAAGQL